MPSRPIRVSVMERPDAKAERIGEEENEHGRRRQHEPEAEEVAVLE